MKKIIEGEFEGHKFLVENKWFGGLKVFHNDELLEHSKKFLSIDKSKPFIAKTITIEGSPRLLEVYAYAMTTVKLRIEIDGLKIAGDDF